MNKALYLPRKLNPMLKDFRVHSVILASINIAGKIPRNGLDWRYSTFGSEPR